MSDRINQQADEQRFQQLLHCYVTHQLSPEDTAFVEAYLAESPRAIHPLEFTHRLRYIVQTIGADRNPELTLNRLLSSLPAARQGLVRRLVDKWPAAGFGWRLVIVLVILSLLGFGATALRLQALIEAFGEMGFADAVLILM